MKVEVSLVQAAKQFSEPPARDDSTSDKHFVSKGEQRFDRLTYGAIGYGANVALSLAAVYWVERMAGGQKFMKDLIGGVKKILPKLNEKTAQWIAARSFYLTGGFAVLVPMKLLEDRKVDLVKKWDRDMYGPQVDTNPTLQKSHAELEAAPKQSWASIMGSRIISLIPFYAVVGLLWSNKSPLAKITNGEFRALDKTEKQARLALEDINLPEFTQKMSKGFYWDRPLTALGRFVGKTFAKLTGNTEALNRITTMEKTYPGLLKEGAVHSLDRDPDHSAIPYYFASETITSAMVAWGVYAMSRLLAPILGHKTQAPAPAAPQSPMPQSATHHEIQETNAKKDTPSMTVSGIEHHATAASPALQPAR